jgi:hypothetical protein
MRRGRRDSWHIATPPLASPGIHQGDDPMLSGALGGARADLAMAGRFGRVRPALAPGHPHTKATKSPSVMRHSGQRAAGLTPAEIVVNGLYISR